MRTDVFVRNMSIDNFVEFAIQDLFGTQIRLKLSDTCRGIPAARCEVP